MFDVVFVAANGRESVVSTRTFDTAGQARAWIRRQPAYVNKAQYRVRDLGANMDDMMDFGDE